MSAAWRKKITNAHRNECLQVYRSLLRSCDEIQNRPLGEKLSKIVKARTRHYQNVGNAYKAEALLKDAKKQCETLKSALNGKLPEVNIESHMLSKYRKYLNESGKQGDVGITKPHTKTKKLKSNSIFNYVRNGEVLYHLVSTTGGDTFLRPKFWPQSQRISGMLKKRITMKENKHRLIQSMSCMLRHAKLEDEFMKAYISEEDVGYADEIHKCIQMVLSDLDSIYKRESKNWHIVSQFYNMLELEAARQKLENRYLNFWKISRRSSP
ncbi:hypothetical protein POMI540_2663 [Schizosaccharomyces pombe]